MTGSHNIHALILASFHRSLFWSWSKPRLNFSYERVAISYAMLYDILDVQMCLQPLLIPHRELILCFLVNEQRYAQILFYVYISIYNSLHVSITQCSSSGETNCINTASGNCHSMLAEMCAGWKKSSSNLGHQHSYQRLYWYNLSLLMMSTMWSKHVESYK